MAPGVVREHAGTRRRPGAGWEQPDSAPDHEERGACVPAAQDLCKSRGIRPGAVVEGEGQVPAARKRAVHRVGTLHQAAELRRRRVLRNERRRGDQDAEQVHLVAICISPRGSAAMIASVSAANAALRGAGCAPDGRACDREPEHVGDPLVPVHRVRVLRALALLEVDNASKPFSAAVALAAGAQEDESVRRSYVG
jgi:hypothetical protein